MNISEKAITVGTDGKGDVQIFFEVCGKQVKNEIVVESKVWKKYGEHIGTLIESVLAEHDLTGVRMVAKDTGALDFTWKARLETAIMRWKAREGTS